MQYGFLQGSLKMIKSNSILKARAALPALPLCIRFILRLISIAVFYAEILIFKGNDRYRKENGDELPQGQRKKSEIEKTLR